MEVKDYKENYSTGWISVYRSIKDHWVFENDKYFKWWVLMLFEVNHSDNKFTRNYNVYTIKKGQSVNSLRTWSLLFKTSPKTVSKFFKLLESDAMICVEKIGKGKQALSLITIENYSTYQAPSKQALPQEVNKKETKSKQTLPTNNNGNNENNDNKEKSFNFFWLEYPNKVAKSKCKEKFLKLNQDDIDKIVRTIKSYIAYKPFEEYNHPNPYTYLNQERWNDEIQKESTVITHSYPVN